MPLNPGLTEFSGAGAINVKVENAAGTVINPATEETLESVAGFNIPEYDFLGVTYPDSVTEVYVFKTGGSGGTTVGTLTVVYTDATKANLLSVTKS